MIPPRHGKDGQYEVAVPVLAGRVQQCRVKNALEPEWEGVRLPERYDIMDISVICGDRRRGFQRGSHRMRIDAALQSQSRPAGRPGRYRGDCFGCRTASPPVRLPAATITPCNAWLLPVRTSRGFA